MPSVCLGVGSNINKEFNMRSGIRNLMTLLHDANCSPIYESIAVGFDGDNFLNCVVVGQTDLNLFELNKALKHIEMEHGREALVNKYSSKTLDIDILTYEDLIGEFDSIILPRDEIISSAFVLKPLSDVLPNQVHPVERLSYASLWNKFSKAEQELWQVELSY